MTQEQTTKPLLGGCACGAVRFQMIRRPLFVHCCHCRWCQRETGSAFVINALIEADQVETLKGAPVSVDTPSESGQGQVITRCPECSVGVWSTYSSAAEKIRFVRVGTLDDPDQVPPDIHIFTTSKQPWLRLNGDVPIVPEYYRRSEYWPAESVARYDAALGR